MGNNANKKAEAAEFNAARKYRLAKEEKRRLDKVNNPENYHPSRRSKAKARLYLSLATTLTTTIGISGL
jgi:hypothetical protein